MSEPTTRAKDLVYVRIAAPDLAGAETFLKQFGLVVAERTKDAIYWRGSEARHHVYVLTEGEPECLAIAFEVDSMEELARVAARPDASEIEKLDEPGGGSVVRLRDPQGMSIELVYGIEQVAAIDSGPPHTWNDDGARQRLGKLPGVKPGPAHVRRLGHVVLEGDRDPQEVYDWYRGLIGVQMTDSVTGPSGRAMNLFARFDRGREYVDHHAIMFQPSPDGGVRLQHAAFEVDNIDDLMAGSEYLRSNKKYKQVWGIGRHRFGGQIFDYWRAPWGMIHEHWTDTDVMNEDYESVVLPIAELRDHWGPAPTLSFLVSKWNLRTIGTLARIGLTLARARLQKAS